MRRVLLACVSSFVVLVSLGAANKASAPDFRALHEGYEHAIKQMNVDEYMSFFTDDFSVATVAGESLGKQALAEAQRATAKGIHVNDYNVTVESVTPLETGDFEVIVLQQFDRDQAVAAGQTLNVRNSVVRRETWHDTGRGWKIRQVEDLLVSPTQVRARRWL